MFVESLFAWASTIPAWLATIVLSALPITESRLTIPVAILSWHLSPITAYGLAMIGNAIPFPIIFFGFRGAKRLAERYAPWSVKWFDRILEHAQKKLGNRYQEIGLLAVAIFVAVPLPGTGVWTGSLLAVALDLSVRRALLAILGGMLVMGAIVLIFTMTSRVILN